MEHKYYSITEMSEILEVNRSSVFRVLKKENVAPATTKGNKNLYDATVLQQLKKHFSNDNSKETKNSPTAQLIAALQQQINDLRKELSETKRQANEQLARKDEQISGYQKLLDQNQQLLLNEQNKELSSIPKKSSIEDNASKLHNEDAFPNIVDQSPKRRNKHWWSNLFSN